MGGDDDLERRDGPGDATEREHAERPKNSSDTWRRAGVSDAYARFIGEVKNMATRKEREPIVTELTPAQARAKLDRESRRLLGISGDEFLRRYEAGELEWSPEEFRVSMTAALVRGEP